MMYPSDFILDGLVYLVLPNNPPQSHSVLHITHPTFEATNLTEVDDGKSKTKDSLRIVVVSDTHGQHIGLSKIPMCDVFIHCGDILLIGKHYSKRAAIRKLHAFNQWLATIPAKLRLVVGGNHDKHMETLRKDKVQMILTNATYLLNDTIYHEGLSVFGSPVSFGRSGNQAFQSPGFLQDTLASLPEKVDILITHGQCPQVQSTVSHKIHIWGHKHNSHGVRYPGETVNNLPVTALSICAPVLDGQFRLSHPPIVLDIPRRSEDIRVPSYSDMLQRRIAQLTSQHRDDNQECDGDKNQQKEQVPPNKYDVSGNSGTSVLSPALDSTGYVADSHQQEVEQAHDSRQEPTAAPTATWSGAFWSAFSGSRSSKANTASNSSASSRKVVPVIAQEE